METTPNVSNTAPIESINEGVSEVSEPVETSTESKSEPKTEQSESFEAWLKRRQESEGKKEDKKPSLAKEPEAKEPKNVKSDEIKAEEVTKTPENVTKAPEAIKVGDKEYKAQDIEQLSKSIEEFKTKEAETVAELKGFIKDIQQNPFKVLKNLKVSEDLIYKAFIKEYMPGIDPETGQPITPEMELESLKREKKEREDREAREAKEAEERADTERNMQYWKEKISESLKIEGVPETEWTVNRMAGYINQARMKKIQVSNQDLAKLVKEDMETAQLNAVKGLTPEQLVKALGEEGAKKFREYQTQQFKQTKFENKNPSTSKVEVKKKDGKKYSSPYDMLDDI